MHHIRQTAALGIVAWLCASVVGVAQASSVAVVAEGTHAYRITVEGALFTRLQLGPGERKPILFPVYGPGQVPMTRQFPMVKGVPGEADDHPHHQSIWFAHGDINGVDFWHQKPDSGVLKVTSSQVEENEHGEARGVFLACLGESADGQPIMRQDMRFWFGADEANRWIDVEVVLSPMDDSDRLVFGETKEGAMAIRTHPNLRLSNDPRRGVRSANGQLVNSEGIRGKAAWGKSARWLSLQGEVEGAPVGLVFLAHPDNVRYPAPWHARHYGLLTANPFGGHAFDRSLRPGSGALALGVGESLRLRYRLVFTDLAAGDVDPEKRYVDWTRESQGR